MLPRTRPSFTRNMQKKGNSRSYSLSALRSRNPVFRNSIHQSATSLFDGQNKSKNVQKCSKTLLVKALRLQFKVLPRTTICASRTPTFLFSFASTPMCKSFFLGCKSFMLLRRGSPWRLSLLFLTLRLLLSSFSHRHAILVLLLEDCVSF